MIQGNMFEEMYETFQFKKKTINLFEAFAGIGSQAMALKILAKELGFILNTIGISEIDKPAIASYNAIHGETKNFGSITDIKELPPGIDIFTYSFPCQDISLAGKQGGLTKGSETRSGLLWEVERLIKCSEKPKVLLMENVKNLVGEKHRPDFLKWIRELEDLGYSNYWKVLNAKHFGIPQNRERVFMISILGEYNYSFPQPFELRLRLKDILQDNPNGKYNLSKLERQMITTDGDIKRYVDSDIIDTFKVGDAADISFPNGYNKANRVFEGYAPSLTPTTIRNIVVKVDPKYYLTDEQMKRIASWNSFENPLEKVMGRESISGALTARGAGEDHAGMKILSKEFEETTNVRGVYLDQLAKGVMNKQSELELSTTLKAQSGHNGIIVTEAQTQSYIRKITPREAFRLMGFNDEAFDKASKVCKDTQLYRQAGNSIVVDNLYYLFKPLFV